MKTRDISRKATVRETASRDLRGTRTGRLGALPNNAQHYDDPTICETCGALYTRKTWRQGRTLTHAKMENAAWATCPACTQKSSQTGYGRLILRGVDSAGVGAVRRRVRNVAARAAFTQPEHRIVSMENVPGGMELLLTSQKLAHRVIHELKKAFGGRAAYRWSDADNSLYATWHAPSAR